MCAEDQNASHKSKRGRKHLETITFFKPSHVLFSERTLETAVTLSLTTRAINGYLVYRRNSGVEFFSVENHKMEGVTLRFTPMQKQELLIKLSPASMQVSHYFY